MCPSWQWQAFHYWPVVARGACVLAGGPGSSVRGVSERVVVVGWGFPAQQGPDIPGLLIPSILALPRFVLIRSNKKYYVN